MGRSFCISRWALNLIKSVLKEEGRGGFNMEQKHGERTKQRGYIVSIGDGERGLEKE